MTTDILAIARDPRNGGYATDTASAYALAAILRRHGYRASTSPIPAAGHRLVTWSRPHTPQQEERDMAGVGTGGSAGSVDPAGVGGRGAPTSRTSDGPPGRLGGVGR